MAGAALKLEFWFGIGKKFLSNEKKFNFLHLQTIKIHFFLWKKKRQIPGIPFKSQQIGVFPRWKVLFPKVFSTKFHEKFLKIQPRSHIWTHLERRSFKEFKTENSSSFPNLKCSKKFECSPQTRISQPIPKIHPKALKQPKNQNFWQFSCAKIRIFTWNFYRSHSQCNSCGFHPHSWNFSMLTAEASSPPSPAKFGIKSTFPRIFSIPLMLSTGFLGFSKEKREGMNRDLWKE